MIEYESALQAMEMLAAKLRVHRKGETVPLRESIGAVLAEPILSPRQVPPFTNSAMDGFAVRSAETQRTLSLRVAGSIAAGDTPPFGVSVPAGFAFEIMTGAPVPDSYNAVIKIEETVSHSVPHGNVVTLARAVTAGENVRLAGEDFEKGQVVLAAGIVLREEHVLVLATLGIAQILVHRRPRIALIATGSELVELGSPEPLGGGQIYNATAPYLLSALGAQVTYYGTVPDDLTQFLARLELALREQPDLVITTGAVSMGKHDFIMSALRAIHARVLFHKVAIRPGKPIVFAELAGETTAFCGLPGNAISTVIGARFFVTPYLRALLGTPPEKPWQLRLANSAEKPETLRCFFKARLDFQVGTATILPGQASSLVSPLLVANGWVVLDEGREQWRAGDRVLGLPFREGEVS